MMQLPEFPTRDEVAEIERRAREMRARVISDALRGAMRAVVAWVVGLGARLRGTRTA